MPKNKHSKDRLHRTVTELASNRDDRQREYDLSALHRRLKFDSCCLSLNTIKDKPMGLCGEKNFCYIFECQAILKFLEKYNVHPITGKKVEAKDLIELKFHKNTDGQYHCPVLYKLFNQHSKLVANRKSGHVYLYEAYYELNLKPKFFKDLLTDESFDKDKDIVIIQDPDIADNRWNVTEFYYIKNNLKLDDDNREVQIRNIDPSGVLKSSLEEYRSKEEGIVSKFYKIVGQGQEPAPDKKLDKVNSAVYSDGALSSSVTSTIAPIAVNQKAAILTDDQILYPRIKKKGYVQLSTNFGPINLELFCDRTPKTCHNFLILGTRGYYNDTIFHRLIKNFIIQGGDPTGTGTGGQSAWGEAFRDECHADLRHEGRGVLAMANSGPNTSKSQFYITLRGVWDHLDGKHTVFGRVVGGLQTLDKIEAEVEVDKKDRPVQEVKILKVIIYVDPFAEIEKRIEQERREELIKSGKLVSSSKTGVGPKDTVKKIRSGVGAYINIDQASNKRAAPTRDVDEIGELAPKRLAGLSSKLAELEERSGKGKNNYGNFSNW